MKGRNSKKYCVCFALAMFSLFALSTLSMASDWGAPTYDNDYVRVHNGNKFYPARYGKGSEDDLDNDGVRDDKQIRYKVANDVAFIADTGLDHNYVLPVLPKPDYDDFTFASTLGPGNTYVQPLHYGFQLDEKGTDSTGSENKTVILAIRLIDLEPSEVLDIAAEVSISRCGTSDIAGTQGTDAWWSPCDSKGYSNHASYSYAIQVKAALYLGNSHDCVTNNCKGNNAGAPIRISDWTDARKCKSSHHHCNVAVPRLKYVVKSTGRDKRFLLLVAHATRVDSGTVRSHVKVEVERRKNSTGMMVTRFGKNFDRSVTLHTNYLPRITSWRTIHTNAKKKWDVFQTEIGNLRDGDVIIAESDVRFAKKMTTVCNPLFKQMLVLTERDSSDVDDGEWRDYFTDTGEFENTEMSTLPVSAYNGRNLISRKSGKSEYKIVGQVKLTGCGSNCTRTLRLVGKMYRGCVLSGDKWKTMDKLSDGSTQSYMSYQVYRRP